MPLAKTIKMVENSAASNNWQECGPFTSSSGSSQSLSSIAIISFIKPLAYGNSKYSYTPHLKIKIKLDDTWRIRMLALNLL